ncbi:MAG TPA: AMP-binding acetyl-CoA synthetase [Hydrogenophaga sp.]|jgi:long-chain acyl-CoA synthetase|uniref:AMP-binding protein n=1 Tax=Hydrogenophaga sp. TaxID=1904254 RepID=UPI0008B8F395|nr:AMP-binding protein [Hydrogenophaga sp.]MBU4279200.1 AMP-binding protein [Gammaproteobacteria bacterium]OGA77074.1 MAG: AMP-binding acetyl-CoA synthetase [Burkholderiales bacterium GWE1_65_30]OGA90535.1 MAG: AMP-binding acetyl-CoA synthetase [Burkholderiales bacterium GWF1_66_17]OGB47297.1 MAG: AMP-binding acetyl-CoA synthetase [Burkholderiales bacterium RIFCSPHIGHO2_12_FULL_67_38]PKO78543.1 MAG: AMP-binding acetyl-CoA synthetase [Betaproteobacteria bacterium HGW-Betaproteobacteria-15]
MSLVAPELLSLQRLYHWEQTAPNRVALTQPLGSGAVQDFTWGQIGDQVRRMAVHLQSQGWEPGSKVAILSKNCAWWMMSDLAIWMAGHVSVPLYPTLAPETVRQILTHSEARACFIGKLDGWEGMKPGVPDGLPCISYPLSPLDAIENYEGWDAICGRTQPLQGTPLRQGDELATLIYTSGTTGSPKGVMHSFENFAWALDSGLKRIPMSADDRMLSYLPLAHVVERMLVEHGWLRTGMQVYFAESLDTFAADLQRARPTIFFSVPRLWVKFQQGVHHKMPPAKLNRLLGIPILGGIVRRKVMKALGLDQCQFAAGGAAHMPLALLQWYSRLGLHINEGYGMTENLALSHITEPGKNQQGTVGPVYEGVEHRIDPATGEVQMRSQALMLGYYKDPEKSREAFTADGWLRTGDKGEIDAQGLLRITGRVKDLFKTGKGKYVAPAPIEDKLVEHEAVEACVVTGANLGQPLGIVMLNPEAVARAANSGTRAELESSLAQHLQRINATLDPHEQLQCIVLVTTAWTVDNDVITPTFKVKRNRIEDLYAKHYEAWENTGSKIIWSDL